ncbi:hypothetical protein ALNOE001_13210 [Candidatus Methanobinarius endosymbioticus]|uniref:Uncharacterized protein n=1 Tax=Candidatus Methanobinarius endosymbioticus TaxID=2006182 RepID=A0A366MBQ3_9EURY|nr:hypothetical protein ALNOE001_13210 [Candidatus Methanobinarius endosymbioticus]
MGIDLFDSTIIINIEAKDATSFRASLNSAIKWISLSVEIAELAINRNNK